MMAESIQYNTFLERARVDSRTELVSGRIDSLPSGPFFGPVLESLGPI